MDDKPLYKPIRVVDSSSYDTQRGTHRTKQVHYVLADGTRSYVEFPHDQYTAEAVQSALQEAAEQHYAVMGTIGPSATTYYPGMYRAEDYRDNQ